MRTAAHGRGEVRKPGAYLFWTTRNRVLDRRRRADTREATEMLVDDLEQSVGARYYSRQDDELAQLLDQDATAELLEDALRAAVAAQDHLVVRVVTVWLELAEETGEAPTSRKVAREVGASHTSINQALRRMRAYFPAGISRTSSE